MAGSEPNRRVVVAGSINMDVVATADHHPFRGETVLGRSLKFLPGGKGANQAVAAARLGAPTALFGRVGADAFGETLFAFLSGESIALDGVARHPHEPTGTALIVVAGADNTIVVVPGANATLSVADVDHLDLRSSDVLVVQFEVPLPTVERALERAKDVGATTIVNPAPSLDAPEAIFELADVIVVNEIELGMLAGAAVPETRTDAIELADRCRRHPDQVVIATLGREGAVAVVREARIEVSGRRVAAVDTTGAGDCFVGAFAAGLSAGLTTANAIEQANRAAAVSVQRAGAGASMPTRADLDAAG